MYSFWIFLTCLIQSQCQVPWSSQNTGRPRQDKGGHWPHSIRRETASHCWERYVSLTFLSVHVYCIQGNFGLILCLLHSPKIFHNCNRIQKSQRQKCPSYAILRNFKGSVEMVNKCKLKTWANTCNDCHRHV